MTDISFSEIDVLTFRTHPISIHNTMRLTSWSLLNQLINVSKHSPYSLALNVHDIFRFKCIILYRIFDHLLQPETHALIH